MPTTLIMTTLWSCFVLFFGGFALWNWRRNPGRPLWRLTVTLSMVGSILVCLSALISTFELAGIRLVSFFIPVQFILLALAVLAIVAGIYVGVVLATATLGTAVYTPRWLRDQAIREGLSGTGNRQANTED